MKHTLYILPIIAAIAVTISMNACSIETDDSGKLGGLWKLTGVDTLSTNGHCDTTQDNLFWAIQGKILEVEDKTNGLYQMFRYRHEGNQLSIYDARINNRDFGDSIITDITTLQPCGVNQLEETFTIETLTGSKMILRSDMLRLYFKKF